MKCMHSGQRDLKPLRNAQPEVLLPLRTQLPLSPLALDTVGLCLAFELVWDESHTFLVDPLSLAVVLLERTAGQSRQCLIIAIIGC